MREELVLQSKLRPRKRGKGKIDVHPAGSRACCHEESQDSKLFLASMSFYIVQTLGKPCKSFHIWVLRGGAASLHFKLMSGPGHPTESLLEFVERSSWAGL